MGCLEAMEAHDLAGLRKALNGVRDAAAELAQDLRISVGDMQTAWDRVATLHREVKRARRGGQPKEAQQSRLTHTH